MAVLASSLGVTALCLACAGLYGLLAYAVSRQSKEIGLRLALGSTRRAVVWAVLRDCLIIAAVGIAIGAGASLALGRYVRTLLFEVSATDTISLIAAGLVLFAVAALAGLVPARRAAAVDPAAALRGD
jgi:ABC-type antimicrobial peptide transport system permease subunit